MILKRLTVGDEIKGSDLLIGREEKSIATRVEVENLPKNINIAIGYEDNIWFLLGEQKVPSKIVRSYDDDTISENHTIVLELNGKINEEYIFSEQFKVNIVYTCTKEPNIFAGQEKTPHRTSQITNVKFEKWSKKKENERK